VVLGAALLARGPGAEAVPAAVSTPTARAAVAMVRWLARTTVVIAGFLPLGLRHAGLIPRIKVSKQYGGPGALLRGRFTK